MKKRFCLLTLVGLLSLAACTPRLSPQPVDNDPARLSLRQAAGDSYSTLNFWSGALDVYALRLVLTGSDLRVNALKYCAVDNQQIRCTVPSVPAGGNFVLPISGSNISAVAVYKRSSSGVDHTQRTP